MVKYINNSQHLKAYSIYKHITLKQFVIKFKIKINCTNEYRKKILYINIINLQLLFYLCKYITNIALNKNTISTGNTSIYNQ